MQSADIRNVILLGHSGVGKTSMAEAMLYNSKAIGRLGKIMDGNTTLDYDPEEIKRQYSINLAIAPVEWKKKMINFIDTPGALNFIGEILEGVSVADAAVVVLAGGVAVGAEKGWELAGKRGIPRAIFLNKMNDETVDFDKVLAEIKEAFGNSCVPVQIPIIENRKFVGFVDTLHMKAKKFKAGGDVEEIPVPASVQAHAEEIHGAICEAVAETDEELMMKFFEGEEFTEEEIIAGFTNAVKSGSCAPVLLGAASDNLGMKELADFIVEYFPSPVEAAEADAFDGEGKPIKVALHPEEQPVLFVFKTVVESSGRMSIFKVITGTVKNGDSLHNVEKNCDERVGQLYMLRGKTQIPVQQLTAGEIGAIAKLSNTATGDTLSGKGSSVVMPAIQFPEAQFSQSITCLKKGDDDKLSQSLAKMRDEDKIFTFGNNIETGELVINAVGEKHLDILVSKLKSRYGVEVKLATPKVAYRETIRKKVTEEYTHKKQSGGSGQYGKVVIEFEPGEQDELEFGERVVGGAVPKQYFPSVEKGLQESVKKGVLAGYPMVKLKATLIDGKYHPVDSKEVAFVTAASMAYRNALPKASPVLLEPIYNVKVNVPDKYMGDVIGDLNKRRGRVLGMNPIGGGRQEVEAEVPAAEMFTYATDLTSIAQARASYTSEFVRYEEVPANVAQAVIEAAKAEAEE
ncbi:MAG: elongation factor G [Clostridia bacterium]|nr:elongation factor G [Clostridia bacterium]MBO7503968.1 elongation factor G [Clostridia bacterium]MBP5665317.1 elongation factor G [Clostridia bacterium]